MSERLKAYGRIFWFALMQSCFVMFIVLIVSDYAFGWNGVMIYFNLLKEGYVELGLVAFGLIGNFLFAKDIRNFLCGFDNVNKNDSFSLY